LWHQFQQGKGVSQAAGLDGSGHCGWPLLLVGLLLLLSKDEPHQNSFLLRMSQTRGAAAGQSQQKSFFDLLFTGNGTIITAQGSALQTHSGLFASFLVTSHLLIACLPALFRTLSQPVIFCGANIRMRTSFHTLHPALVFLLGGTVQAMLDSNSSRMLHLGGGMMMGPDGPIHEDHLLSPEPSPRQLPCPDDDAAHVATVASLGLSHEILHAGAPSGAHNPQQEGASNLPPHHASNNFAPETSSKCFSMEEDGQSQRESVNLPRANGRTASHWPGVEPPVVQNPSAGLQPMQTAEASLSTVPVQRAEPTQEDTANTSQEELESPAVKIQSLVRGMSDRKAVHEGRSAANAANENVNMDLVLDMDMADILGFESTFKEAVVQDVADAVGGRRDKVHVLALEAGSIIVKLRLETGVCGQNRGLSDVARELQQQAEDAGSALKRGRITNKTKGITVAENDDGTDTAGDIQSLAPQETQRQRFDPEVMALAAGNTALAITRDQSQDLQSSVGLEDTQTNGNTHKNGLGVHLESSSASASSVESSEGAPSPIPVSGDVEMVLPEDIHMPITVFSSRRKSSVYEAVVKSSSGLLEDEWALTRMSSVNSSAGSAGSSAMDPTTPRHLLRTISTWIGEDCAADITFLQQVVKQLESQDPKQATSAAAALEYLVSSSDPKREGRREGLLSSFPQWTWTAEGAKANRRMLGMISNLWRNLLGLLSDSNPATQAQVCGAMSKLGFRNTKNVLEMVKYPKMLIALTDLLDMDKHAHDVVKQAWRVLQNFVSGVEEIKVVLCSTEHLLTSIKQACTREGVSAEVRMRAVSVIMHASSSDEARVLLVRARVAEEALQVVMSAETEKEEATRIRATLASANLCGREERSILSTAPEMLRAIGETIWHAFHGTEYHYIKWSLAGVMLPLFNLSCSDSNKRVLSQCGTVSLLLQALSKGEKVLLGQQDAENGDKLPDHGDWSSETLELILRTVANFTFDVDAKEQMLTEGALAILTDVLKSLRDKQEQQQPTGTSKQAIANADFSAAGTQWVSAILIAEDVIYMLSEKNEDMITENRVPDDEGLENKDQSKPGAKAQHIMISYSWASSKDFVVKVSAGLRKSGFDVWRDEEGSSLVRKMMGSSMEIMAQAIENADVVVIFVSRAYRDSYNCKLEGKYAQVRERAGLTKILFVMMEEDYTPESNGGVDGWLGMLIGDHIYYPGWDPDSLNTTVSELSRAIHKMRNDNCSSMTIELSQGHKSGRKTPERERSPLGGCGPNRTLAIGARQLSAASLDDSISHGLQEMKGGAYVRPTRRHPNQFAVSNLSFVRQHDGAHCTDGDVARGKHNHDQVRILMRLLLPLATCSLSCHHIPFEHIWRGLTALFIFVSLPLSSY